MEQDCTLLGLNSLLHHLLALKVSHCIAQRRALLPSAVWSVTEPAYFFSAVHWQPVKLSSQVTTDYGAGGF